MNISENKHRYLVHMAFDGTNYHGWQKQPNAPTIQETIEDALCKITKQEIMLIGCGRTDTGVHARKFFAHFDCDSFYTPQELSQLTYKLNGFLDEDIVIFSINKVDNSVHSRFSPIKREYKYYIITSKDPFRYNYAYKITVPLDVEKMNAAAKLLVGTKDFQSFSKVNTQVNNFICTVFEAYFTKTDNEIVFTISANRFLRNMVRAIVGSLIDVGLSKCSIDDFNQIIESKDRCSAGLSVPAKGLFLNDVVFE